MFDLSAEESEACSILGLNPNNADQWTTEQVVSAYRKKQRTAHPDKGGNSADSAVLNDAHKILKNFLRKRDAYSLLKKNASNSSEWNERIQLLIKFFFTERVEEDAPFFIEAYTRFLHPHNFPSVDYNSTDSILVSLYLSYFYRAQSEKKPKRTHMLQILFHGALLDVHPFITILENLDDFSDIHSLILETDSFDKFYSDQENPNIITDFYKKHRELFNKIFSEILLNRFPNAALVQQNAYLVYLERAIDAQCFFNAIKYFTLEDLVGSDETDIRVQMESRKRERVQRLDYIKENDSDNRADVKDFHRIFTQRIVFLMELFLIDGYTEAKFKDFYRTQLGILRNWLSNLTIDQQVKIDSNHVLEIFLDIKDTTPLLCLCAVLLELKTLNDVIANSFFKKLKLNTRLNALLYESCIHFFDRANINKYLLSHRNFVNRILSSKHDPEISTPLSKLIEKINSMNCAFSLQEIVLLSLPDLKMVCFIAEHAEAKMKIVIEKSATGSPSVKWGIKSASNAHMRSFPLSLLKLQRSEFQPKEIYGFAQSVYDKEYGGNATVYESGCKYVEYLKASTYQVHVNNHNNKNNDIQNIKNFFASDKFKNLEEKIFNPLISYFAKENGAEKILNACGLGDMENLISQEAETNNDIFSAVHTHLVKKFNEVINSPILNQQSTPWIAFLKGLLGILLAIPAFGIPLAFESYRDVFFKPPGTREVKKIIQELML